MFCPSLSLSNKGRICFARVYNSCLSLSNKGRTCFARVYNSSLSLCNKGEEMFPVNVMASLFHEW